MSRVSQRDDPHPWSRTFGHPLLQEIFEDLYQKSPTFRKKIDALAEQSFLLRLAGVDELDRLNQARGPEHQVRPSDQMGAVSLFSPRPDGSVNQAAAFFDVDRIHAMAPDSAAARDALRDAVIHEVYGHIVPVAKAGSMKGDHRDPKPGERFERSPVGKRENKLRQEIGLLPRTVYGLFDR